jgi:hypothetical protein
MRNIFDSSDQSDILQRLEKLHYKSICLSGKMNPTEMLAHCCEPLQVAMGDIEVASNPIGLIKKLFSNKKEIISDEHQRQEEFIQWKNNLIIIIERLRVNGKSIIKSEKLPRLLFSGRVTKDKWAEINYTHIDHHLRQFGV